jgi:hypothetical protein
VLRSWVTLAPFSAEPLAAARSEREWWVPGGAQSADAGCLGQRNARIRSQISLRLENKRCDAPAVIARKL